MFIEVNLGTAEKMVVNMDLVKKIIPMINGVGCVFHFDQGTVFVKEPYDDILSKLSCR